MAVRRISSQNELQVARAAFHAVFRSADAFDEPFQPTTEKRAILYPVAYHLDQAEYASLAAASSAVGESEAFFSAIEGYRDGDFDEHDHWRVGLHSYPYEQLRHSGWFPLMESAIYSTTGSWGLLISHEQHAMVGGTAAFMDSLLVAMPGLEIQVTEFLVTWKDNRDRLGSDVTWLPELLEHVYGPEKAYRLMQAIGMG